MTVRAEAWHELLDSLILATRMGRAEWRGGPLGTDSLVLARSGGSVVIRSAAISSGLMSADVALQLRDERGEVVDQLRGADTMAFSTAEMMGQPNMAERMFLQEKAKVLLSEILERGTRGEEVARRIIDDL